MRVRSKPSQWLNQELKREMFKRDWLRKKAMKTRQPNDWKSYKSQKIFVDKGVVKAKKEYFRKQMEQSSGDQRATWKVLNDQMGKKSDSTYSDK